MRGRGEGSIYRRSSDNRWVGQVELARHPDGKRRRARVVRNKRAEVVAALDELRRQVKESGGQIPDRETVLGDYLEYWLQDVVSTRDVTESTLTEYRKRVRRISKSLGRTRLVALTTPHVRRFAVELSNQYEPKTARSTLESLRSALRSAEADGLIFRNPAEAVSIPRTRTAKVDDALTEAESEALLKAADGAPLEALFWFALKYGLRLGELLDLRWADVDFDADELTVHKSKTRSGVRTLPLITEAKAQLRRHHRSGNEPPNDSRVFCRDDGRRLSPQMTRKHWNDLLKPVASLHG